MKIGLSFSRCVRDIVEKKINISEVLVIIARTDFDPYDDGHWVSIWEGYRHGGMSDPEWADAESNATDDEASSLYRSVTKDLYDTGKLHQPRQFGAHPSRFPYYWLECVVPEDEHNPAQQKAWDNYKMITGLS